MVKWATEKRATEIWATEKWATGKKGNGNLGNHLVKMGNGKLGNQFTVNWIPLKESTRLCAHVRVTPGEADWLGLTCCRTLAQGGLADRRSLAACTYAAETWTPFDDGLPSRMIKR